MGTNQLESPSYDESYEGRLYLEKGGVYYSYDSAAKALVKAEALSLDFVAISALLNVGAHNYFDSWRIEGSSFTLDVYGDIDVRDTVSFTLHTVANITTSAGSFTNSDYYIDRDSDGIGDTMERSRYEVANSVVNNNIHGNIRIDHMYIEVSMAEFESGTGNIFSKTVYVVGSGFVMNAYGSIEILNSDDASKDDPAPAAQFIWCQDDFVIKPATEYKSVGVVLNSEMGSIKIITSDGKLSSSNTVDLYITGSTVTATAAINIETPETEINVEDGRTFEGSTEKITDTVDHASILRLDETTGDYRAVTAKRYADEHFRAYGSEITFRANKGDFVGTSWQVEGARLVNANGENVVNDIFGRSAASIMAYGDAEIVYDLTGRSDGHIATYGETYTAYALTVLDGARFAMTSAAGAASVYDPEYTGADTVRVAGESLSASELKYLASTVNGLNGKLEAGGLPYMYKTSDDVRASFTLRSFDTAMIGAMTADIADVAIRSIDGDILFDRINGYRTTVSLDAEGAILALHTEDENGDARSNMIRLTGREGTESSDTALYLRAGSGDIGQSGAWTYLDVACPVTVAEVTNLYLDFFRRDAEGGLYYGIRDYLITAGYTDAAAGLMAKNLIETGTKLDYLTYSDEVFFIATVGNILNDSAWIAARKAAIAAAGGTLPGDFESYSDGDKIVYLFNNDQAYRNATLEALYNRAMKASIKNEAAIEAELASAESDYNKAQNSGSDAEARIAAAERTKLETDGTKAVYTAELSALNAELDSLKASGADANLISAKQREIAAKEAAITALESVYTKQNAIIAEAGRAITAANDAMAEAMLRINDANDALCDIRDAYAEFDRNGGASYVKDSDSALLEAHVDGSGLTKLYDETYGIYDVNGTLYYKNASGEWFTLNDCILEAAAAPTGEKLLGSGELYMDEAAGERTVYYGTTVGTLTGFTAYHAGRTAFERIMDEAETAANNAATQSGEARTKAEAVTAGLEAGTMTLADAKTAYNEAAALLANAATDAGVATNKAIGMIVTLMNETTYSDDSLTDSIYDAVELIATLTGNGTLIAGARALEDAIAALKGAAAAILASEQRIYAEAKVGYETAGTNYSAVLKANNNDETAQAVIDAKAGLDAAKAKLDASVSDATKPINEAGTGTLDNAWAGYASAATALKNAGANVALLAAFEETASALRDRLCNTHLDSDARDTVLNIGEIRGEAWVKAEGDIIVTVDKATLVNGNASPEDGDITIGTLDSKRGDVTVVNRGGAILASDASDTHITGNIITLDALGDIGSKADPIITEERSSGVVKVVSIDESIYRGQKEDETVSAGGFNVAFGTRFEEFTNPGRLMSETDEGYESIGFKVLDGSLTFKDLRDRLNVANLTGSELYELIFAGSMAGLEIAVRYDGLRVYDSISATSITASSDNGSIYLKEKTGDMNITSVTAVNGNVGLEADGSIFDILEGDGSNVIAGGDAALVSDNGTLGTEDDPIYVEFVDENGDNDKGSLEAGDENGAYLRIRGSADITLSSESGIIEAATVSESGDITVNDIVRRDSALTGYVTSRGSVSVTSVNDIGTLATAFELATEAENGGTAYIEGENVYVNQAAGDMLLTGAKATGDLVLTVAGSITDVSGSDAAELAKLLADAIAARNKAENALDALEALKYSLTDNGRDLTTAEIADKYNDALAAQTAIETAEAALEAARASLEAALEAYTKEAINSGATLADIETAMRAIDAAEAELNEKQKALDTALGDDTLESLASEVAAIDGYRNAKQALADAITARRTAEAEYGSALAAAGGNAEDETVKAAAAALTEAENNETAARAAFEAATDAYNKVANYYERALEATDNAKDAYNGAGKELGYADGEAAVTGEEAKLVHAKATLDAAVTDEEKAEAQAAYDGQKAICDALEALKTAYDGAKAALDALDETALEESIAKAKDELDRARMLEELARGALEARAGANEAAKGDDSSIAYASEYVASASRAAAEAYSEYQDKLADATATDEEKAEALASYNEAAEAVAQARAMLEKLNDEDTSEETKKVIREALELIAAAAGDDGTYDTYNDEIAKYAENAAKAAMELEDAEDEKAAAEAAVTRAEAEKAAAETALTEAENAYSDAIANGATDKIKAEALAALDEAVANLDAATAALAAANTALTNAPTAETVAALETAYSYAGGLLDLAKEKLSTKKDCDGAAADEAAIEKITGDAETINDRLTDERDALYGEDGLMADYEEAYEAFVKSANAPESLTGAYIMAGRNFNLDPSEANRKALEDARQALIEASSPNVPATSENEITRRLNALDEAFGKVAGKLDEIVSLEAELDAALEAAAEIAENGNYSDEYNELIEKAEALKEAETDYYDAERKLASAGAEKAAAEAAYDAALENNAGIVAAQAALEAANEALSAAQTAFIAADSAYTTAMTNYGNAAIALNGAAEAVTTAAQQTANADGSDTAIADELGDKYAPEGTNGNQATVEAGGNATVISGGSVTGADSTPGADDGSLSVNVAGDLTVNANGDVDLSSTGDLSINRITTNGNDVTVDALGDITSRSETAIEGDGLELNAFGGDIGSANEPLRVDVNVIAASGDDINITNASDTTLRDIIASGDVAITSGGSITGEEGTVVRGDDVSLEAKGDIGSADNPLDINANTVTAGASGDINLESHSNKLVINDITAGGDVTIEADGAVVTAEGSKVTAGGDITVTADGDIGEKENPFTVDAGGKVNIFDPESSEYGHVYLNIVTHEAQKGEPQRERFDSTATLYDDPARREYIFRYADGTEEAFERPGTTLMVYGYFDSRAFLYVGSAEETARMGGDALRTISIVMTDGTTVFFDYDIRIDRILEWREVEGRLIPVVEPDYDGEYAGEFMWLTLYIGESYNGRIVEVTAEINGIRYTREYRVSGGYIAFELLNTAQVVSVYVTDRTGFAGNVPGCIGEDYHWMGDAPEPCAYGMTDGFYAGCYPFFRLSARLRTVNLSYAYYQLLYSLIPVNPVYLEYVTE